MPKPFSMRGTLALRSRGRQDDTREVPASLALAPRRIWRWAPYGCEGDRRRPAGRPRARRRPRRRHRPSRHQARERDGARRRLREGARLRPGPRRRRSGRRTATTHAMHGYESGRAARHDGLHVAGAGARRTGGRAGRRLRARHHALRDGGGPPAVRRADDAGGADGDPAGGAGAARAREPVRCRRRSRRSCTGCSRRIPQLRPTASEVDEELGAARRRRGSRRRGPSRPHDGRRAPHGRPRAGARADARAPTKQVARRARPDPDGARRAGHRQDHPRRGLPRRARRSGRSVRSSCAAAARSGSPAPRRTCPSSRRSTTCCTARRGARCTR